VLVQTRRAAVAGLPVARHQVAGDPARRPGRSYPTHQLAGADEQPVDRNAESPGEVRDLPTAREGVLAAGESELWLRDCHVRETSARESGHRKQRLRLDQPAIVDVTGTGWR